ncbi:hypothetical protein [Hydrogenophaga sp.]|uniref:hypothetical protein n=1 Tax=Hydrogenophaga sp. TaxID=1904254 RepID=UPI002720DA1C|nr:hypothetical protein [Hydrogenophaga sp.]MDO9133988.1 hypothetical protein [Hydrogenophaga sp.]
MSKASQRKRSRTPANILTDTDPSIFMEPSMNAEHAKATGKIAGLIGGKHLELSWKRYVRKQGDQFDLNAHTALDEDMNKSVKPLIEAIQSAMIKSQDSVPEQDFDELAIPYVSGTMVVVYADEKTPWRMYSMPYSTIELDLEPGQTIVDCVAQTMSNEREYDCDVKFAFWFTSCGQAWAPFMVSAVHGNGASATYCYRGSCWAKGPPHLMPYSRNGEEIEVLGLGPDESNHAEALKNQILGVLGDSIPSPKAQDITHGILQECHIWAMKASRGMSTNQVLLAREVNEQTWVAQQYLTWLKHLRTEFEQTERKARKSAARVAELEKEVERLRGLVAKQKAPAAQVKQPSPPVPQPARTTSLGERMGVFFG